MRGVFVDAMMMVMLLSANLAVPVTMMVVDARVDVVVIFVRPDRIVMMLMMRISKLGGRRPMLVGVDVRPLAPGVAMREEA